MEARTFEMEFAKFIQRFHQDIRDAFIEDTFNKREILGHYQLGREMLEELADSVLSEFTVNIDKKPQWKQWLTDIFSLEYDAVMMALVIQRW